MSLKRKILQYINDHEGRWGWYQLERVINPREVPSGCTLMDVLNALERAGLIARIPGAFTRYVITEPGLVAITLGE